MAKILRYQQDALASQLVGVPSADTSAAGLASTIGGAAAGIQSAQNQLQYQQSARNAMLAANSFQQVEGELRQRNAEAKAAQAHKQALQNDITAAWHTDRLERKHAEYIAALKDATKNNVDGVVEEYQKNADKMIRDYAYENNLQANPDVYAKVIGSWATLDKAANKDIYNYKESQGIKIAKYQVGQLNQNRIDDMRMAPNLESLKKQIELYGQDAQRNLVAYGEEGWLKADETVTKGVREFLSEAARHSPSSVQKILDKDGNPTGKYILVPGEAIKALDDPDLARYVSSDMRSHIISIDDAERSKREHEAQVLVNYEMQSAMGGALTAIRTVMAAPETASQTLAELSNMFDSIPNTKEYQSVKQHLTTSMTVVRGLGNENQRDSHLREVDAAKLRNFTLMSGYLDAKTKQAVESLDTVQAHSKPSAVKLRQDIEVDLKQLTSLVVKERGRPSLNHFATLKAINEKVLDGFKNRALTEPELRKFTDGLVAALDMMAPGGITNVRPDFVRDFLFAHANAPSEDLIRAMEAANKFNRKDPNAMQALNNEINSRAASIHKRRPTIDKGLLRRLAELSTYRHILKLRGADIDVFVPSGAAIHKEPTTITRPKPIRPPAPDLSAPPPAPNLPPAPPSGSGLAVPPNPVAGDTTQAGAPPPYINQ